MEVIIAEDAGLCYGVRRALKIVRKTRNSRSGPVYTLGDLIHNPRVISDLAQEGILSQEDPGGIDAGTVIIRSHGVSPDVYDFLKNRNLEVVDATCPIVKRIQNRVKALSRKEIEIIIVGSREHPESIGLLGYSREKGIVIQSREEAEQLPWKKRRAVLSQSTQDMELFKDVIAALVERTEELAVFNTICRSTLTRQKSTRDLACKADTMIIIGGRNSSNTRKLHKTAAKIQSNTYFVENACDISPQMLRGSNIIGLSGGASTPPEAIQEAVEIIQTCFKHSLREKDVQCQS